MMNDYEDNPRPPEHHHVWEEEEKGLPLGEAVKRSASHMKQTIELDCAPGGIRPGGLLDSVIEGTGLTHQLSVSRFFGNWTWCFCDVSPERWAEIRPILKERVTKLFNEGKIRYGSW